MKGQRSRRGGCCREYLCNRSTPILVRRGGLSGRWYVLTDYRVKGELIEAVRKHDVTDELVASLLSEGWTPPEYDGGGPDNPAWPGDRS